PGGHGQPHQSQSTQAMNTLHRSLLALSVILIAARCAAADPGVTVVEQGNLVRVTWPMSAEENGVVVFSLDQNQPIIESLAIAAKGQPATPVLKALNPVTLLTVGSRDSKNPQGWGAFFDNTPKRPY